MSSAKLPVNQNKGLLCHNSMSFAAHAREDVIILLCRKCKKENPDDAPFCSWCGVRQVAVRKKQRRANGMGSTFYDASAKSWCAERTKGYKIVTIDGKQKKMRVPDRKWGFKTKRDAESYLRERITSKTSKKTETLQELHATWKDSALLKLSKSKQTAYKIAWRHIEPISYDAVESLGIADLQGVVKGLTYYPARDVKSLLSHLYTRAAAQGYVSGNLSQYIVLPELITQETEKISSDEVTRLWKAYGNGDLFSGYILLMVYTGMMPGELMKLKKGMIDWTQQRIVGCGSKTKKRKEMPIVFPDFVAPVLAALCDASNSKIGNVLAMNKDNFYKEFKALKIRCELRENVQPYSSRRATGTELALKGVPHAVIMDAMRQTDYQTTLSHYTLLDTSDILSALNKMDHPTA